MGIPLVALGVHTPDPLQQAQQGMSLRALGQATQQQAALAPGQLQQQQNQVQLGQQAVQQGQQQQQDREAGMKAIQEWDGKDINQLPDLVKKNGGSIDAYTKAKMGALQSQQAVLQMNTAQLQNNATKNDYLLGKLQAATGNNVTDDKLADSLTNATQEAIKDGYLDPQHAQSIQQLIQQYPDPKDLRTQLGVYEKGLLGEKEQFQQQIQQRTAGIKEFGAPLDQDEIDQYNKDLPDDLKLSAGATSKDFDRVNNLMKTRDLQAQRDKANTARQQGLDLAKQKFQQGQLTPNDPQYGDLVGAVASNAMKVQDVLPMRAPLAQREAFLSAVLKQNPDYSSGDYGVIQKVKGKYTSGNVADQLLAINTAREHMKTFTQLAAALDNGDVQKLEFNLEMLSEFSSVATKLLTYASPPLLLEEKLGKAFDGAGVVGSERDEWRRRLTII